VDAADVPDADRRALTLQERIVRNGHRPAVLLVPNSIAGAVERALFESGFQTIVLRENDFSSAGVASLINPLWSVAFVALVAVRQGSPEIRRTLEAVAGDALVDFADVAPNFDRNGLLEEILAHAESLRVRSAASIPGEDD
jgi:hypothetical protein